MNKLLKGKHKSNDIITEEEFEATYYEDETAFDTYKRIIESFNEEELRRKEENKNYITNIRTPISAEWGGEGIIYCLFQKQNCGTLKDSKGYYDKCKCVLCGRIRKRRNIDSSDISKIICKTDKKNSVLYEKNKPKRIKKVWCSNCQKEIKECQCSKKYRDWN